MCMRSFILILCVGSDTHRQNETIKLTLSISLIGFLIVQLNCLKRQNKMNVLTVILFCLFNWCRLAALFRLSSNPFHSFTPFQEFTGFWGCVNTLHLEVKCSPQNISTLSIMKQLLIIHWKFLLPWFIKD